MRKFIGMLMILVLVITTTMVSSVSHAMPQAQPSEKHDCHHGSDAGEHKSAHNNKDNPGKKACCEKDACQCMDGTYHSGFANIFGNDDATLFAPSSGKSRFAFTDEFIDSALSKRLKRPPRA